MTKRISIPTFYKYKKLVIFFIINIMLYPVLAKDYFHTVRENQNYRFITNDSISISINKKTKKYIFSTPQASVQVVNENLLDVRVEGKYGFHFYSFNVSVKKGLSLSNYRFQSYKKYSSNCSLVQNNSNKSLKDFSDLSDSIRQVAASESVLDKEYCSQLSDEYQPKPSQMLMLLSQLQFEKSNLMRCVDLELSQQRIKGTDVEKIFNQMYLNFNQILSGIRDNKNKFKISCSNDDNEKANVKLSAEQDLVSINFKIVRTPNDFIKAVNHELIHISTARTYLPFDNNDYSKIIEKIECLCGLTDAAVSSSDCGFKEVLESEVKGVGSNHANMNISASTAQEIQNSPAVQNFQPVSSSTIATLANETLREPSGIVVAQGYSGPILQQGSFDNAARAVADSFAPLMNTVAASITRLEAAQTTPSGNSSAAAPQAAVASTLKSATSRTSSVGDVGGAVVVSNEVGGAGSSSSAESSATSGSGRAALALGQQLAASKMIGEVPAASAGAAGEVRKSINSKMSGETVAANGGGQVARASSGRGVDSGGEVSSPGGVGAGGESANLVRQPASDPKTFTPGRAVVTLNTLSSIKGNMYEATKEYYSNDNFKEGLRINGIQIQDGAQVLGSTQKPKKIFIDDGQSLTLQKK